MAFCKSGIKVHRVADAAGGELCNSGYNSHEISKIFGVGGRLCTCLKLEKWVHIGLVIERQTWTICSMIILFLDDYM